MILGGNERLGSYTLAELPDIIESKVVSECYIPPVLPLCAYNRRENITITSMLDWGVQNRLAAFVNHFCGFRFARQAAVFH